jgi:hypothetical protein
VASPSATSSGIKSRIAPRPNNPYMKTSCRRRRCRRCQPPPVAVRRGRSNMVEAGE